MEMRIIALLAFTCAPTAAQFQAGAPWPIDGADAAGSNAARATTNAIGYPRVTQKWAIATEFPSNWYIDYGYSPVIDANGNVYVSGAFRQNVTAISPTGRMLWQRPFTYYSSFSALIVLPSALAVIADSGEIYGLSLSNGTLLWARSVRPTSWPARYKITAYAASASGLFFCDENQTDSSSPIYSSIKGLSADGRLLWSTAFPVQPTFLNGLVATKPPDSEALYAIISYFDGGGALIGMLYAFNPLTGAIQWSNVLSQGPSQNWNVRNGYSSGVSHRYGRAFMVVEGGGSWPYSGYGPLVLCVSTDGRFATQWLFPVPQNWNLGARVSRLAISGSSLYAYSLRGLYKLDLFTGQLELSWIFSYEVAVLLYRTNLGSPIVSFDGAVFIPSNEGLFAFSEANLTSPLWLLPLSMRINNIFNRAAGLAIAADGTLIFEAVDPETNKPKVFAFAPTGLPTPSAAPTAPASPSAYATSSATASAQPTQTAVASETSTAAPTSPSAALALAPLGASTSSGGGSPEAARREGAAIGAGAVFGLFCVLAAAKFLCTRRERGGLASRPALSSAPDAAAVTVASPLALNAKRAPPAPPGWRVESDGKDTWFVNETTGEAAWEV